MTSQIITTNINSNYPVAGQDNDSQGFRDNFRNIKMAINTATMEITELQLSTAKINTTTSFNNNIIQDIILKNNSELALNTASISGSVNFNAASFHKLAVTTTATFTVINWPNTGAFAKVRMQISPTTSTSMTINFDAGTGVLLKESSVTLPYTSTSTSTTVWDMWTTDGGESVFLQFVGGPFT